MSLLRYVLHLQALVLPVLHSLPQMDPVEESVILLILARLLYAQMPQIYMIQMIYVINSSQDVLPMVLGVLQA